MQSEDAEMDLRLSLTKIKSRVEAFEAQPLHAEEHVLNEEGIVFVPSKEFSGKDFVDQLLRLKDEVRGDPSKTLFVLPSLFPISQDQRDEICKRFPDEKDDNFPIPIVITVAKDLANASSERRFGLWYLKELCDHVKVFIYL